MVYPAQVYPGGSAAGLSVWALRPDGTPFGQLTRATEVSVVHRWNDVGRVQVTFNSGDEWAAVADRRTRLVVTRDGQVVASGRMDGRSWKRQSARTEILLNAAGDESVLGKVTAWPSPDKDETQQGAYDVRTGPAETVWLDYVAANVDRLGLPVSVAASQGRGPTVTGRARFTYLLDLARELFAGTNLGFRVVWDMTLGKVNVAVVEGADRTSSGLISPLVGTDVDESWEEKWPTGTRAIFGADGEGADRSLSVYVNTPDEAAWDDVWERFLDRRDLDSSDPTFQVEVDQAALREQEARAGVETVSVKVADSPGFQFGVDYWLGDVLRAYPATVELDARVTETMLSWRRDRPLTVTLTLGDTTQADSFGERVRRLERL